MREGHQSEVLLSIAEEFPADLCFTLVFQGRQGNLDLVADSPEEAQAWIQGVRKLIHKTQTMDEKERLDQYPFAVVGHSVRDLIKELIPCNLSTGLQVVSLEETIVKKCGVID